MNLAENESPRILIIDDNPSIHRDFELVLLEELTNSDLEAREQRVYGLSAAASLHKPAYLLEHAHSGFEGIKKVRQSAAEGRAYQMAFVDIRMPDLDGVETIERIWKLDARIQMVICTAYADYSQEDLFRRLGQTDKLLVLKKPFDNIEVTQLARTLTEKWYLTRQAALKVEQMELLVSQRTQKLLDLQRREFYNLPGVDPAKLRLPSGQPAAEPWASLPAGVAENFVPPADSEDVSPSAATDETSAGNKLPLILLVENHADVCLHIRQILGNGYEIVEARNGREGMQEAREGVPDLIIADVRKPDIDGMELCRELKNDQITSHIPIILLAVHDTENCQLKALEAGADDYVAEPSNLATLKVRVENLLESRRRWSARFHHGTTLQPRDLAATQTDAHFLQRVIAAIERNMSDYEFGVDTLATQVAVSRRQLFRKLKALVDMPPKAFIRSVRVKRAAQLLLESEMTVTEITFAVGFLDVKHFRALFKEQFGVLPSEYIRKCPPAQPEDAPS